MYAVMRKKNAEKMLLIEKILVVTNVILTLIYMINGFNAKQTIEEQSSYYQVTTSAMIPFIIVVVLATAYFAVTFFVKENFSLSSLKQKTAKTSEMTTADELAKYKNLLDEGAITQDEYDAKKKELLGL
ncbi:MAG: SHOCT domain-containing protein [Clostridia bacterium]|nr:SHOCT domain-containing protein [Clostridia bacterium]